MEILNYIFVFEIKSILHIDFRIHVIGKADFFNYMEQLLGGVSFGGIIPEILIFKKKFEPKK